MITLCAAAQGAEVFFHVFMEVSLSVSASFSLVRFISCFWENVFEYRHQVKDFHVFVFSSMEGDDCRSTSVHR